MSPILTSVLLGLTAAGANVFGGAIIVQRNWERSYLRYFVALGAGFMLATALVEMVPESIQAARPVCRISYSAGYLLVHFFEHTVTPHFHFGEETHADQFVHAHKGYSVLIGLLIHTFFDGIAIASGFLVSPALGWIIFIAVFLHKIPEGFTVSSVMLASGRSRAFAWGSSVALGVATVAGVMTMAVFRHEVASACPCRRALRSTWPLRLD
jgi:zinc and cadmium transporter